MVFEECNLHDATFAGATLTGTDFRGANLEASRVRPQDLHGAILTPLQALALFQRATGADVRDADT